MKRITVCFCALLLLLAPMYCFAAEAPALTFAAVKEESTVTLTVSISENSEICGCKFNLFYDNTKLQYTAYTVGEPVRNTSFLVNPTFKDNAIRVVWAGIEPLVAGGTVLTVSFAVKEDARGTAAFTADALRMVDIGGANVECSFTDTAVTLTEEETDDSGSPDSDNTDSDNTDSGNTGTVRPSRPSRPSTPVTEKEETAAAAEQPAAPEPIMVFSDVKETAWYYSSVLYAKSKGLMNGVSETEFAPETKMTRAMAVTILYRLAGSPTAEDMSFTDVAKGVWYADSVAWAAKNGIVNGVGDGLFAPEAYITREQLATILCKYTKTVEPVADTADLSTYGDGATVSAWATESMQWAIANGVITGKNDKMLCPADTATRAEVATMLYRYLEK